MGLNSDNRPEERWRMGMRPGWWLGRAVGAAALAVTALTGVAVVATPASPATPASVAQASSLTWQPLGGFPDTVTLDNGSQTTQLVCPSTSTCVAFSADGGLFIVTTNGGANVDKSLIAPV